MSEKYGIELPAGTSVLDPAECQGDWHSRISLEVDAQAKELDEARSARESYSILIPDPSNNLEEAKKRLYPKMFDIDKADLEATMTPPAQPARPPLLPSHARGRVERARRVVS